MDLKELAKKYEPTKPKDRKPFDGDKRHHHGARYSPCGKYLIAGGCEGQVFRWDVTGDLPLPLPPLTGHGAWVQAYGFAPSGKLLFTGDSWGRLRAWNTEEWKVDSAKDDAKPAQPVWDIAAAHQGWLRAIAVRPDGRQLATCGRDQIIRVWDTATGKKLRELSGHGEDVFVLRYHPDGQQLVSGDLKGIIKHWQVDTGQALRELDAKVLFTLNRLQDVGSVRCLAFDAKGETLLAGGTKPVNGGNVQGTPLVLVFDWASGKQTGELTLGAASDVYVCDLQYDARGFFIAGTSGNPGTGKIALLRSSDKEAFYTQSVGNCHAVSVNPAGDKLAVTVVASRGGNGRGKNDDGSRNYPGAYSPVTFFDLPVGTPLAG